MANQLRDWSGYDHVGAIIEYENGEFEDEQTIELFQYLLDTGTIYHLQGSYQRMANTLIEAGVVSTSVDEPPRVSLDDLQL